MTIAVSLRSFPVAGLAIVLAACTVGPDYQKPEAALPPAWIAAKDQQAEIDDNATQENWWKNFNDPVLAKLIDMALANNLDLKIAEARIDEARATRETASAALLPQGDAKFSGVRQANQIAFPGGDSSGLASLLKKPYNTFETGFDASWELDLFGGHRRDIEAASATLEANEASRDDTKVSMLAEVARTYMDVRQYQAQLAITQDTIKADEKSVDIAKQRFNAGEAPRQDLTQAEALLDQAQTQIPVDHNLIAQAEFSLDVLLGEQPGVAHAMVGDAGVLPVSDTKLVLMAPAKVIAQRPDIRVAERKLASATAQQGVAAAQFFPDISLSGFIGLLNTDAGNLLMASSKSWMMGGSVLWPILSYGKLSANQDAADAQQKEALAVYQKTMIAALSRCRTVGDCLYRADKFRQGTGEIRRGQRTREQSGA